ncbi:F-box/LRR-repeat protein At4g14103 [Quercus suber]|uniref:F-box/LRR-repeat protein At4g14103 n=1 Tax=Quercus suber TaxID=58331 RepID=UPI000CE21953|nr:F-box/LRR-repeat protein At4g14103-like [Quercus suber]POF18411.1 f-box/fbd/lrr-repeat protein [Quercus suber]
MVCSAESTSKRQKPEEADRISNLPKSLLCRILSLLTTKEAVVTSILSSRWKTLWTLVPKLDFDYYELTTTSSSAEVQSHKRYNFNFAHIVSRVWALRSASQVQKFRLHWGHGVYDPVHMDTWVRAAIARGVEDIDLNIDPNSNGSFYLPCSLFNCKTLIALKLSGNFEYDTPPSSSIVFPSLKILHLEFNFNSCDYLFTLPTLCPVLQDLSVKVHCWYADWHCKFISPTLKRLHLYMEFDELPYKLEIKAPALEYLNFGGHLDSILLEDLSNLVEAVIDIDVDLTKIDYYEHYGSRVWDFIGELGDIKSLHLSANTTEFLCNASEFDPPMFHNLSFLKVKGPCMLHVLPHLLQVTPNLAVLVVEKEERNFFSCEKEESFTCDMIFYEEPLQQVVRKCLSSCLTTLHYKGFEGLKNELKLVKHFLKRAKVLKTMKISSYNLNSEEELCVLKELLLFPRHSRSCQIVFS